MAQKLFSFKICAAFLLINSFYCCSQTTYGVQHSYAFSKEVFPGAIPIGVRGKPLIHGANISNIIYIEVKGTKIPVWDSAWKDGQLFGINTTEIQQGTVDIGKTTIDGQDVLVVAQKGNHLYRLDLYPEDFSNVDSSAAQLLSKGKIIISGKSGSKTITIAIDHQTALLPERRE